MKYLAGVSVLILAGCSSAEELDVSARITESALVIKSRDYRTASNCLITINGTYSLDNQTIPTMGTVDLPLREFSKGDGSRLLPGFVKTNEIAITCSKPVALWASLGRK